MGANMHWKMLYLLSAHLGERREHKSIKSTWGGGVAGDGAVWEGSGRGGFSLASLRSAPFLARVLPFGAAGFVTAVVVLLRSVTSAARCFAWARVHARLPARRPARRPPAHPPTAQTPRPDCRPPARPTSQMPAPTEHLHKYLALVARCPPLAPTPCLGRRAPTTHAGTLTHRTKTQRSRDGDTDS